INVLAVGQAPTSEQADLVVEARQAAVAGISDYINRVQAASTYTQYCSNGMTKWTCPSPSGTSQPAPTASNPAFVNSPTLAGQWYTDGTTMRGVANGTPSYRYVVNSPNTANPALVTIYSIGQAGSQSGQHATSTEEAALTVCSSGCIAPVTAASCIKVPNGALSAKIVAYGGKGGGTGSGGTDPDAAGGVGAVVSGFVPVTAGDTLDLYPGQPGQAGKPVLLNLLNLFAGAGGAGGLPVAGSCQLTQTNSPPDMGGGNGAIPGGLADALTDGGGGGGGATVVFDATTSTASSQMVAVAGGGGGGGAGNLITYLGTLLPILGDAPGNGGAGGSPAGAGGSAPGLTVLGIHLLGSAPGGAGGTWLAGGPTPCASTTTAGGTGSSAGNNCGQNGYIPVNLLGVATGGGGGGGGGYSSAGVGGGGGGNTGGILSLAGAAGGGGAGSSYLSGSCAGSTIGPASYPVGDTTGAGQISITFYSANCGGSALTTVTGTIRAASPPS
ncbi:MAG TPA: hypothetical protein VHT49_15485, partial [Acidimicrobiales bacterium]|nr:hypothetical protein [Acidimicrobiales bacterium]